MHVLVLYESRGGTTKATAEAIAGAMRARGKDASLRPLGEAADAEVRGADVIVLGTWVQGFVLFRVGPAKPVHTWLQRCPRLDGTPAAVFCTFSFDPRETLATVAGGLHARGATIVGERAFRHGRHLEGVKAFVDAILDGAKAVAPS